MGAGASRPKSRDQSIKRKLWASGWRSYCWRAERGSCCRLRELRCGATRVRRQGLFGEQYTATEIDAACGADDDIDWQLEKGIAKITKTQNCWRFIQRGTNAE